MQEQGNQFSTTTYDDELQIMDQQNGEGLCPFHIDIQKSEKDQKWYITRVNLYHNHPLRRLTRLNNVFNYKESEDLKLPGTQWQYSKHFGQTQKMYYCNQLSDELKIKINKLYFDYNLTR